MDIISINAGYWETKVISEQGRFKFDSTATKGVDDHYRGVDINGTTYKVGEGKRDISLDKEQNDIQLACIGEALERCKFNMCNLVTSLPYVVYVNDDKRRMYEDKLLKFEKVNKVTTYIECAAAQLADLNWYKGKLVALHDVGGLTINTMIFEDGKLISGTADSFNLGTIILDNKIKTALKSKTYENYTDYQIPYLFESLDPIIKKVISEQITEHFEEFFQELKKKGYPDNINRRFTGGGALRLKDYIHQHNWHIGEEPQWENALGQYAFGMVKFR
ncbi:MAG: ParM/StbA family protein [Clostridium lundense]|nr:ParM/StbA family protein [Clostridium lundense]